MEDIKQEILSKGQYAISAEANLEDGTWTFQMYADNFVVAAGEFVLIPKEDFDQLIRDKYQQP